MILFLVAAICLIWYLSVVTVSLLGIIQLRRHYTRPPYITLIRPIKGHEPHLQTCLLSTFTQTYPREKLHIRFCLSHPSEPAYHLVTRLAKEYSLLGFDVQVSISSDEETQGPNPKIRNMASAYRNAGRDHIVWILDCNVWVAPPTAERMVDTLLGNVKFVHLLPLVVATMDWESRNADRRRGKYLEEMFTCTSHAKFYTAINTVLIAPCVVGKSSMFRRKHLDLLTDGKGIEFFAWNICEDHLIGDLLWKGRLPPPPEEGGTWRNHEICWGTLAVQPLGSMSVLDYWKRRVRWLRVRKYTVTLATLVEPGTECFLCSVYGAFAVGVYFGWTSAAVFWFLSVATWCVGDFFLYRHLLSCKAVEREGAVPGFIAEGRRVGFGQWLRMWLGRETLALPIWMVAFWGGDTVEWRGSKFRVGRDMRVTELKTD
ncbi:glycosyltransferase family 21 protein [Piedraia hortae CBS 480.64]|uniref:Ceramide glucosyltransferase n=1 Tax=Piedraia hortae CBS 480.64 TaxID=1314780 RepID=A0A6A7BXE5_9PEZI|nr:glycosyltransferase family 21 protein [Piedraia hortae CBS 480.64]